MRAHEQRDAERLLEIAYPMADRRISFPYRPIEKLRKVPPAERKTTGMLTHVYHLKILCETTGRVRALRSRMPSRWRLAAAACDIHIATIRIVPGPALLRCQCIRNSIDREPGAGRAEEMTYEAFLCSFPPSIAR
ncbi:hypothetical protein ACF1BQ_000765 [Bradyrhizobium sp. RDT10]